MGSEILFVIPPTLGYAAALTASGMLVAWLIWAGWRRWRPSPMQSRFPAGVILSGLICITLPIGCAFACEPVEQPAGLRTVAALEVPLPTAADRAEFMDVVGREAAAEGLRMTVTDPRTLEYANRLGPEFKETIHVAIWRGTEGLGAEAGISDRFNDGQVWISFSRGEDPALARRFRERAMQQIVSRWPASSSIPVTSGGSIQFGKGRARQADGDKIDQGKQELDGCKQEPGSTVPAPSAC